MTGMLKRMLGQEMNEGEYDRLLNDMILMKVPMIILE